MTGQTAVNRGGLLSFANRAASHQKRIEGLTSGCGRWLKALLGVWTGMCPVLVVVTLLSGITAVEAGERVLDVRMVKDISKYSNGTTPKLLTPVGDRVFFVADDGTHGAELWVSDGSGAGTSMVKDIRPGVGGAGISGIAALGDIVLFGANDGAQGIGLWRSDGTSAGTYLDLIAQRCNCPCHD